MKWKLKELFSDDDEEVRSLEQDTEWVGTLERHTDIILGPLFQDYNETYYSKAVYS